MATAKKPAKKAPATVKKAVIPSKTVKLAPKKAAPSKVAKATAKLNAKIAALTVRKNKLNADIQVLRDQRAALKVAPPASVTSAPVKKAAAAKNRAK